jgi:Fe-S cluster assembly ATP-binding protein
MNTPKLSGESLIIKDLHVSTVGGREILRGLSLNVNKGEKHAIMGPNGGGKSTLAMALMGHPDYVIDRGSIAMDGNDITCLPPDRRAKLGLFLGFQYPVEVSGVNFANFLRLSANETAPSGKKISPIAFRKMLQAEVKTLGFSDELPRRSLNQGFSGGEKKKAEILQMAMLRPKFAILDEPDSGLDVDALRYIATSINSLDYPFGLVLITHHRRILDYVKPDFVHVLKSGRIIRSGDLKLANEIERFGYEVL